MKIYDVAKKWLTVIENHENGIDYEYGGILGNVFFNDFIPWSPNYYALKIDLSAMNNESSFNEYLLHANCSIEIMEVILALWEFNAVNIRDNYLSYSTLKHSMVKAALTKVAELELPNCIEIGEDITKIELTSYFPDFPNNKFLSQELTISKDGKVNIKQYRSKSHHFFEQILPREVDFITTVWIKEEEVSIIFDMIRDFFMCGYEVKYNSNVPTWQLVVLNGQVAKNYKGHCIDDYYQRLNKISDFIREVSGLEYINAFSLPELSNLKSICFEYCSQDAKANETWFFSDEGTHFYGSDDLERSFKFDVSIMEILRNLDSNFFSNSVSWSDHPFFYSSVYSGKEVGEDVLHISFNYDKYSFYISFTFVKEALPIEWGMLAEKIKETIKYDGAGIFNEKLYNTLSKRESDIPILLIGSHYRKPLVYRTSSGVEFLIVSDLLKDANNYERYYSSKESESLEVKYIRPHEAIRAIYGK